jgi:signal peptidase II
VIILVAPLMLLLDQLSKLLIHTYMRPHDSISVIPDWLNLYYVQNSGLVFGLFADQLGTASTWVYLAINLFALGIIFRIFRGTGEKAILLPLALSMVLAGALGNLIDRLRWRYVVDFVQFYYVNRNPPHLTHSWGIFNIADVAITMGIVFLVLDSLRPQREAAPQAAQTDLESITREQ